MKRWLIRFCKNGVTLTNIIFWTYHSVFASVRATSWKAGGFMKSLTTL